MTSNVLFALFIVTGKFTILALFVGVVTACGVFAKRALFPRVRRGDEP